jgi:hypothetical protein
MLASFPASMLNQKPSDLGILNRFKLDPSRSSRPKRTWSAASLMMATRSSDTADVMMPGPLFVARNNNRDDMEVPELTSSVGINLNERIPLQRSATAIVPRQHP